MYLYLYKYENVCLFICLSVHVFLGHFETDRDSLWHKLFFSCFWECSKTIIYIFLNSIFKELLPFFYISLRFLCKFEERLRKIKEGRNLILFAKNRTILPNISQVFVMAVCFKSGIIAYMNIRYCQVIQTCNVHLSVCVYIYI